MSVLLLGDPRLREVARAVEDVGAAAVVEAAARLRATLERFRARHGFGRAIAAPQIGVGLRLIALQLPGWPDLLVDPEITWRSDDAMTLWDDCMSFPDLLVRVRRQRSISLRFHDATGAAHERARLDPAAAELLQHEVDHLDGVLAVDRAAGQDALVLRAVFAARPDLYRGQVDYWPGVALPGPGQSPTR